VSNDENEQPAGIPPASFGFSQAEFLVLMTIASQTCLL
jgi:hypothetical protein